MRPGSCWRADGPLALDPNQLFIVARRIGEAAETFAANHCDLQVMFMAAAPQGQQELDFEAEDAAILQATRRLPLRLVVEETGNKDYLGERLNSGEGPFEALHLSCHGEIDERLGPVLLLEKAEGGVDNVSPGGIIDKLRPSPPPLVVLSACRTAEFGRASSAAGRPAEGHRRDGGRRPQTAAPFARQLATRVANVVGWDGSVYDADASDFATIFYRSLANGSAVPEAAAAARRELLRTRAQNPKRGLHWHLARAYLAPKGGGR